MHLQMLSLADDSLEYAANARVHTHTHTATLTGSVVKLMDFLGLKYFIKYFF